MTMSAVIKPINKTKSFKQYTRDKQKTMSFFGYFSAKENSKLGYVLIK